MKFLIKDFFSKYDQILRKQRIWAHLLKKFLMKNFIFCARILKYQQFFYLWLKVTNIKLMKNFYAWRFHITDRESIKSQQVNLCRLTHTECHQVRHAQYYSDKGEWYVQPFVMIIVCDAWKVWYHLHNLKNMKNTQGRVLFLVRLHVAG